MTTPPTDPGAGGAAPPPPPQLPPPPPYTAAAPYAPPGYGAPYPSGPYAPYGYPQRPMQNGLGVAALVCGIVGAVFGLIPFTFWLGFILGVLGIVFGLIGRRRADRGEASNRGQATAGFVLGIVSVVFAIIGLILLISIASSVSSDSCQNPQTTQDVINCND